MKTFIAIIIATVSASTAFAQPSVTGSKIPFTVSTTSATIFTVPMAEKGEAKDSIALVVNTSDSAIFRIRVTVLYGAFSLATDTATVVAWDGGTANASHLNTAVGKKSFLFPWFAIRAAIKAINPEPLAIKFEAVFTNAYGQDNTTGYLDCRTLEWK